MHILYIDDSGSVRNPSERYFILGGVCIFERGLYHQIRATDECVRSFGFGEDEEIELHGTDMYSGRSQLWHSIKERAAREKMIHAALDTLKGQRSIRLFATVIDKMAVSPRDPIAVAFEEMCNRFNLFLARTNDHSREGDQKGLIIMDECTQEQPLQNLARKFRVDGARWGPFRNLAEVPLFVNSKASRMVQLADLVAWATFRKFEYSDGRFFDPIIPLFDACGGVIHGLFHYRDTTEPCYCPACITRQKRPL